MTKWQEVKLAELATIKYGKNQKDVAIESSNIPIYGTGGIIGYASKALYDKPSVLIGRKGTIDKVRYVTKPFWTVDTLFWCKIKENHFSIKEKLSNFEKQKFSSRTLATL